MQDCFTLMLGFDQDLNIPFDAARIKSEVLSWLTCNHTRPSRNRNPALVVHASNTWSQANIDLPLSIVREKMLAELAAIPALQLPTPDVCEVHRWRYAETQTCLENNYILDADNRLAACGDWCMGNRVEAAFLSAQSLASALVQQL